MLKKIVIIGVLILSIIYIDYIFILIEPLYKGDNFKNIAQEYKDCGEACLLSLAGRGCGEKECYVEIENNNFYQRLKDDDIIYIFEDGGKVFLIPSSVVDFQGNFFGAGTDYWAEVYYIYSKDKLGVPYIKLRDDLYISMFERINILNYR